MALTGVLEVEVEVKSEANKYWEVLVNAVDIFPKAFPNDYQKMEAVEGDGKSSGSIRLITYGEGSPLVKTSKERIEEVDSTKKSFSYSVMDGDMLKYYKKFKGTVTIVPKEKDNGSVLKWKGEFEKTSDEIPDPHAIQDFAVKNFKELDDYILAQ